MKAKKKYNPFDDYDDEAFVKFLYVMGHDEPVWEECSEEEYREHQKEVPETFEDFIEFTPNPNYKREPIYDHGGLLGIVLYGEKPIGWKHYKKVGTKRVIVITISELGDLILDRMKRMKYK